MEHLFLALSGWAVGVRTLDCQEIMIFVCLFEYYESLKKKKTITKRRCWWWSQERDGRTGIESIREQSSSPVWCRIKLKFPMVWIHSGALSLTNIADSMSPFPRVLFIGRNYSSRRLSGGLPLWWQLKAGRKSHALARFSSKGLNRARNSSTL